MSQLEFTYQPPRALVQTLAALVGLGVLTWVAGLFVDPQRAWGVLLMVSFWLLSMGLAGSLFVGLQYACGAGWAVAFRRIPEAMTAAFPLGAAGLMMVFLFHPEIFPWVTHHGKAGSFHAIWLNRPFFLARAIGYFVIWFVFSAVLIRNSQRQDVDGDMRHTRRNIRASMAYMVVFSFTFALASIDWVMSLQPEWVSTIFGMYHMSGLFVSGVAMIILLMLWLKRSRPLCDFVNDEHLHDLGKLLFAFSTFWMYLYFSQYMLIWYSNMTEETVYFILRHEGVLKSMFLLNFILNWAVPFTILLPIPSKRSPRVIASMAVCVLAGRWLDLYMGIMPPITNGHVAAPWMEFGMMVGAMALFVLAFLAWFRRAPQTPVRDPLLAQSLSYHS